LKRCTALLIVVLAAGCASTKPQVNMDEPRRIVGTENEVRVDAEIYGDRIVSGTPITVKYDITNHRSTPILVADLLPNTTFDTESGVVTVDIGTEIPGEQFLPRLISISSGEKKSFVTKATLNLLFGRTRTPLTIVPQALRLKINFLGESKPFEKLIGIPEKAVHDPQLAADIFTKWVEGNETVITNAVPMRWGTSLSDEPPLNTPTPSRRRRGGGGTFTPP
jgi:hypothetical protein